MIKYVNTVWIIVVALMLGSWLIYPDWLSRGSISGFLNQMGPMALIAYVLLSLTRSLLLIPCTPFVLAGAMSFPQWPLLIFIISLAGVVVGASLVYSFPSFGGYDKLLEKKYPGKIAFLKQKMQSKYAFLFVTGWSFFPLVPTDAVCYVAGMAKMPLRKMLLALIIGEFPLVTAYVLLGGGIGEWLRI